MNLEVKLDLKIELTVQVKLTVNVKIALKVELKDELTVELSLRRLMLIMRCVAVKTVVEKYTLKYVPEVSKNVKAVSEITVTFTVAMHASVSTACIDVTACLSVIESKTRSADKEMIC